MQYFVFGGVNSRTMGLYISRPTFSTPAREIETVAVPGRNGDLILDKGRYQNVTAQYEAFFRNRFLTRYRDVAAWLLQSSAYRRLEDTYDPDYYRMASYTGPMDIEQQMMRYGKTTLRFNCRPFRWMKSGDMLTTMEQQGELINPEAFAAAPYIKIYGAGAGALYINNETITLKDIDGYVELDSETQNAYKQTEKGMENKNSAVILGSFPELRPGENVIQWSGGVSKIEIRPRWRTL